MRIALLSGYARVVGGIETYLATVIPALVERGHQVAALHELQSHPERAWVTDHPGVERWCADEVQAPELRTRLAAWRPDVVWDHGVIGPLSEISAARIAPSVYFAHGYFGTCISGAKSHKRPLVEPCGRRFGTACLAIYFPRRCGGRSPLTMWRQYLNERHRLSRMRRCDAVIVASHHMAQEYRQHGLGHLVRLVHLPIVPPGSAAHLSGGWSEGGPWRLLFLGRMDVLKGGDLLLNSLPLVRAQLGRPLELIFAGDGPEYANWRRMSIEIQRQDASIQIQFPGWIGFEERSALFRNTQLLVVPSTWPEPFGQVGLEAGHFGVPCAGFRVGGIPSWLRDGVNGYLAPGNPPAAAGLADAIGRCLRERETYRLLQHGASSVAAEFSLGRHVTELEEIFQRAMAKDSPGRSVY